MEWRERKWSFVLFAEAPAAGLNQSPRGKWNLRLHSFFFQKIAIPIMVVYYFSDMLKDILYRRLISFVLFKYETFSGLFFLIKNFFEKLENFQSKFI